MPKKKKLGPNSQGYTNALLEDVDDKFQTILEATAPIPKVQEQIGKILEWESDVKLIPAIFKEVGSLRKDVEIIKLKPATSFASGKVLIYCQHSQPRHKFNTKC